MHESFDYYVDCRLRQRNMGLFTADQVFKSIRLYVTDTCTRACELRSVHIHDVLKIRTLYV